MLHVLNENYEYIIIGSGVAGGILAKSIIEQTDSKVLMLEAGGHPIFNRRAQWLDFVTTRRRPFAIHEDDISDVENIGSTQVQLKWARLWTNTP